MRAKKKSLGSIILKLLLLVAVSLLIAGVIKLQTGSVPFRANLSGTNATPFPTSRSIDLPKVAEQSHSVFLPLAFRTLGEQVTILPNSRMYLEKSGDELEILHIVGEIANGTPNPVQNLSLTAVLYPANGTAALTTIHASPFITALAPGEKTCFNLYLEKPADYARYELTSLTYASSDELVSSFELSQVQAGWDKANAWYALNGQVRNSGSIPTSDVRVIATLYNSTGIVIGCEQTYANLAGEDPFSAGTFSLTFLDLPQSETIASYRVQGAGD